MIKCFFMIHRAPHLSFDEFAQYWSGVHARLAIASAPQMRMRRYVQYHHREDDIAGG